VITETTGDPAQIAKDITRLRRLASRREPGRSQGELMEPGDLHDLLVDVPVVRV
jgi:hypothetical protein